jgi:hypothetical protein
MPQPDIIKKTDFNGTESGGELVFELEEGSYSAQTFLEIL